MEVVETTVPDIDRILSPDPNLRPPGNTKVTRPSNLHLRIPGPEITRQTSIPATFPTRSTSTPESKFEYTEQKFVYNKLENKEDVVYQQHDYPPTNPARRVAEWSKRPSLRNYQPGYRPEQDLRAIRPISTTKAARRRMLPITAISTSPMPVIFFQFVSIRISDPSR
ncbi:hypothetical protein JTB14_018391 [Gonioctena quinquepunctata]|nr:hypothetical protein JTB14_018391 [Gonioctena quinquepunctata]